MRQVLSRNSLLVWIAALLLLGLSLFIGQLQGTSHSVSFWLINGSSSYQAAYDFDNGLMAIIDSQPRLSNLSPDARHYFEYGDCLSSLCLRFDTGLQANYSQFRRFESQFLWLNNSQILGIRYLTNSTEVYLIEAETGASQLWLTADIASQTASLSPNRETLLLLHSQNATTRGLAINTQSRVAYPFQYSQQLHWSPDSRYLAYYRFGSSIYSPPSRIQIMLFDPQTGRETSLIESNDMGQLYPFEPPVWSADSQFIAYLRQAVGRGNGGVYRYNLASGEEELLYSQLRSPRAWSPDGRFLLLESFFTEHATLEILDTQSGTSHPIAVGSNQVQTRQITWSPDGKFIAFDYLPNGFNHNRLLALYDSATGRILAEHSLPIRDFYPLLEGRNGLQWWN